MTQDELLRYLAGVLEKLDVRYFVTGSIATIYYGEPRFTNDIDVVVDLPAGRIPEFIAQFPTEEFYLSEDSVLRAVRNRTMFNIIHPASGLKLDIMIPAASRFTQSRFQRSQRLRPAENLEVFFASAEDVILKKMEFFREGGSDKHLRDIAGILRIRGDELDFDYLEDWADQLGLESIWTTIRERVRG